jgi:organic hydroperoxide reductase OsmC/OhrA
MQVACCGRAIKRRLTTSAAHMPGVSRDVAQDLADAAHTICPNSNAVHGNIEVETTIA